MREGWRHGTVYGYQKKKCRCESCSDVGRRYYRDASRRTYHAPVPEGIKHGANGAMNYGCKCDTCRAGMASYMREQTANRIARGVPAGIHGKSTTYTNYGCRCDECKEAHNAPRRVKQERPSNELGEKQ